MNAAVIQSNASAPAKVRNRTNGEFLTLLKREFWEHRGSFLWAPLILAGIQVLVSIITFATAYYKFKDAGPGDITINGVSHTFPLTNIGSLLEKLTPQDLANGGRALDLFYYASSMWPLLVAGVVAFFYALGAIYDERKDKSLLFWKSMPVSDAQTVASKAVTALVVIPAIAMLVSAALVLIYVILGSIAAMLLGVSPMTLWQHSHPFKVIGSMFAGLPVHAVYALPAAGWLLLCSAFAKRAPFLWAIGLPLIAGVVILWIESGMSLGSTIQMSEAFFENVVLRILPGIIPGSFVPELPQMNVDPELGIMPYSMPVIAKLYGVLLKPATLIGAVAGIAMLWAAVRQRRVSGIL